MPTLNVRRKNALSKILLYTTKAAAGGLALSLRYNNAVYYAKLDNVGAANDSGLRVRMGGKVYQVSTHQIIPYTQNLITATSSIQIPFGITKIRVSAIGGGGAAGHSARTDWNYTWTNKNPASAYGAWPGGAGQTISGLVLGVTPGAALGIAIGKGAAAGKYFYPASVDSGQTVIPAGGGTTTVSQSGAQLIQALGGHTSFSIAAKGVLRFQNNSILFSGPGFKPPGSSKYYGAGGAVTELMDAYGKAGGDGCALIEWGVGIE
jgi:hypothetical protein